MSAQHTPGPWEIFPAYTNANRFPVGVNHQDGSATIFAEVNGKGGKDEQNIANARLIAAAPELLAVCQALTGPNWPDIVAVIMQAHAAVAKATQP